MQKGDKKIHIHLDMRSVCMRRYKYIADLNTIFEFVRIISVHLNLPQN
jgi:hypothetical protein